MCKSFRERMACGAVVVAEDFRILQKLFAIDHALKLIAGDEVILATFLLGAAQRAGGIGDRKLKAINQ